MIEEIHIRDLGVITDAVLPLGPGLTILSGETGAGKTMVVTALGMLLGRRADAGAVRVGAQKAVAEAVVNVPSDHAAVALVEDAGGDVDQEGEHTSLQLSRTVAATGRSRAHVGGRSAPVARLGELGETLVAVHGQSDQLRLTSAAAQRHALDTFAAVRGTGKKAASGGSFEELLGQYRQTLASFEAVEAELSEIREKGRERALEAQSLRAALEEIDTVEPVSGEDEALNVESQKLTSLESLRAASMTAHAALSGSDEDPDAASSILLVDRALSALDQEADSDPELEQLAQRVRELSVLTNDVAADLSAYATGLDEDGPARLAEVEARRAALRGLTKTYGADIDEVLAFAETARTRLESLGDDPHREEQLSAQRDQLLEALEAQAGELTQRRSRAAEQLAQEVGTELKALAMPNAALLVSVEPAQRFDRWGRDTVEFLLRAHADASPRPLGRGASGGELSRLMLALEVVLAAVDPVPTFVFDEVDSGVGGKAALEIGRRLKMLAQNVQVLVVTHLPQVAAFADEHVLVTKSSDSTVSDVSVLSQDERVVELARMLAGHEDSEAAQEHARELLRDAAATP
ncbi:DNA repair protein RecN [Kocuria sp. p3-SID1433]|uniref:DNA repair protein RecN n=1 Tax=unclassified Kocuria TaxID=2649579 RepID=UPI0021A5E5C1|nr:MULTISPECIES: DNA repair protein RecN [unclassified Kocuria]MCT1602828.1 DNA repair protein RecN [Kocuria sp. p3-SID1428]MCT2181017.1 DNA repair protein RecN [Kocuria sp. p3-SID1433]